MCRIEVFDLHFRDGHVERREQLVNTCPRATPSAPCRRTEYVYLHQDRFASQADEDVYARQTAPIIEPSRRRTTPLRKEKKRRSLLDNFFIEFRMWHPFSSKKRTKRKESRKRRLAIESSRGPENRIGIVERLPRAPSPPPAWTPHEQQPIIVTASPRRGRSPSPEHRERPRRRRRRRSPVQVVIHQSSDSSKEDTPSPPEPVRKHTRPQRSRSLSPISTEEATRRGTEKRQRAIRVTQAEREARERAEGRANVERRHNEELQHRPNPQRRLSHQDRPRLETAESTRRRTQRETEERAEAARRHQEQVDLEAHRRVNPEYVARGRDTGLPRHLGHHPVIVHNHFSDLEERGTAFLNNAYQNALRAENRNVAHPRREGLARRETIDASGRRPYEADRRRHERTPGGSG